MGMAKLNITYHYQQAGVHILQIDGDLFPKFLRNSQQINGDFFPKSMRKLRHFWIFCI